ncbi:MAG: ABC transporter permease subunit [Phycisphaerales bacterium JB040]
MDRETASTSRRNTPRTVRWIDNAAQAVITSGGLGVLAAMLGICVFLVVVVAPLFRSAQTREQRTVQLAHEAEPGLYAAISPDHRWYARLDRDGLARIIDTTTGAVGANARLVSPASPVTASYAEPASGWVFLGHENGTLSTARVALEQGLVPERDLPARLRGLAPGDGVGLGPDELDHLRDAGSLRFDASPATVFERLEDGGRVTTIIAQATDPVEIELGDGPVVRVAGTAANQRENFAVTVRADGVTTLASIRVRSSLGGGAPRLSLTQSAVTTQPSPVPDWLMVDADGMHVLAVHADGVLDHYTRPSRRAPEFTLAEAVPLVDRDVRVTAVSPALGARSLLVGDSTGSVSSWTLVQAREGEDSGGTLARASRTSPHAHPVVALATSRIDRTVLALDGAGVARLVNLTSQRDVARLPGAVTDPVEVTMGSDLHAAAALDDGGRLTLWVFDPAYPEVGWRSLAMPIRYEGYDQPDWVYQSTGSPVAETKLSLVPLIWGTLKATIVSMLIAAPLAVLAAIYTSEFLHPRIRRIVKPVIELMASLPSVVLGFVAAMVVAPYLRDTLSEVLLALLLLPVALLIGSTLVRFVPTRAMHRVSSGTRILLIGGSIAVAMALAFLLADPLEAGLFRNPALDQTPRSPTGVIPWLNGNFGTAMPGWLLATVPLATLALFLLWSRFMGRQWGERVSRLSHAPAAAAELARVLALLAGGVATGWIVAWGLSESGADPRESVFGEYSQRNTFVVGLVMGFAVIPIIYTISEDALRAVPSGLRSASLGTGATPWQTAVRVVLPVAGSGIFSACMVGLGRAVGETMIVLMATGNTPEMTANIFSGFRTLAANIAVELPEAPYGGAHYRVLFLCGLVLFVMTLVINTTAEVVRQRVRKKNAAL